MRKISPINRSKKQAHDYYDRISRIYDLLTAGEKRFIRKGVELLNVTPAEKFADIGCGTGTGLNYIKSQLFQKGLLLGIDISHQMLLESQQKIGLNTPGHFLVQGDGAKLPIKSGLLDGIISTFTLELFSKKEMPIVLDEFRRVLKPDGRLVIVAMAQEPHSLAIDIYEWLHEQFPVAIDCRPIPLFDLLTDQGFEIKSLETEQYWGLSIKTVVCKPV